jgi:hypothetical protein
LRSAPPTAGATSAQSSSSSSSTSSSSSSSTVPSVGEVLATFEGQWGPQSCVLLRNACMDQGVFVTFGHNPYPTHHHHSSSSSSSYGANVSTPTTTSSSSSSRQPPPWQQFNLGTSHLDFRGFGDVAGIIQHPPPIIRPGTCWSNVTAWKLCWGFTSRLDCANWWRGQRHPRNSRPSVNVETC